MCSPIVFDEFVKVRTPVVKLVRKIQRKNYLLITTCIPCLILLIITFVTRLIAILYNYHPLLIGENRRELKFNRNSENLR